MRASKQLVRSFRWKLFKDFARRVLIVLVVLACVLALSGLSSQDSTRAQADGTASHTLVMTPGVCIGYHTPLFSRSGERAVAITSSDLMVSCYGIVIDRELFATLPPELGLFVITHEMAHLRLGHGTIPEDATPQSVSDYEDEADCLAARFYRAQWPHLIEPLLGQLRLHDPMRLHVVTLCLTR